VSPILGATKAANAVKDKFDFVQNFQSTYSGGMVAGSKPLRRFNLGSPSVTLPAIKKTCKINS
jgi:hypothetical protein